MRPLDTFANHALTMLEEGSPRIRRESKYRSAWSRFLMSLMMRMPNDIAVLKSALAIEWAQETPALKQRYAELRQATDPETLVEYLEALRPDGDEWVMSIAESLMDHAWIGELINNMRWITREITSEAGEFVTSDRPLIMAGGLGEFDSFILLPIGPKLLFAAVHNEETQRRIEQRDPNEQVEVINRMIAGRAHEFVYARDDRHLDAVAANFGTRRAKSLLQQMAEYRREKNRKGVD